MLSLLSGIRTILERAYLSPLIQTGSGVCSQRKCERKIIIKKWGKHLREWETVPPGARRSQLALSCGARRFKATRNFGKSAFHLRNFLLHCCTCRLVWCEKLNRFEHTGNSPPGLFVEFWVWWELQRGERWEVIGCFPSVLKTGTWARPAIRSD